MKPRTTSATVSRASPNQLPEEADVPEIAKSDSSADPVMFLNLNADNMSALELTDYAERFVVDQLATVPGVARVAVGGGRRYAMRIWLDRTALAARNLTVADIESALRRENVQLPAGRLESQTREFSLRTTVGLDKEGDFRALVIGRSPTNQLIRLGEVADVRLAAEDERSIMNTDGKPGVGIQVEAQSKANMLDVAQGMKKAMERVRPTLPKGMSLVVNMDNSISIEAALHEVVIALALAFVSVLVVIYAFLGSLRATLIPAITIPVSIVATFTAMYALGYTINVLTLLALVLAIGLVVDDAIVVLENIFRRAEEGEPTVVAAVNGSKEIGFAVIATTLTLAAVFIPISFLPGDIGRLFREFGFTLAASVLFSALIALTLTPMLASKANLDKVKHNKVAEAIDRFFTPRQPRLRASLAQPDPSPLAHRGGRRRPHGGRRADVPLPAHRVRADGGRRSHRRVHGSAGRRELRLHDEQRREARSHRRRRAPSVQRHRSRDAAPARQLHRRWRRELRAHLPRAEGLA